MIKINKDQDIKQQFEKEGLCYPKKKSSGNYGLRGSTSLDRATEKESVKATLGYLTSRNIIELV